MEEKVHPFSAQRLIAATVALILFALLIVLVAYPAPPESESSMLPTQEQEIDAVTESSEQIEPTTEEAPPIEARASYQVPILMYHHLTKYPAKVNHDTVQVKTFRAHMQALKNAGFEPVSFMDLRDYVQNGTPLPEKPIVITFDDGYTSNYELAYPILQEFGFKATIFAIGISVGKDTYKDTGIKMNPHFNLAQAAIMEASGLVTVASHGYNFHEVNGKDPAPVRRGVLQKQGESEEDYIRFLQNDHQIMQHMLGESANIIAYPYGLYSNLSDKILVQAGAFATVTTDHRMNTVVKGDAQSLLCLGRFRVVDEQSPADLLAMIEAAMP